MSEQVRLEYHANYKSPPCVAMGEVIVCTFPVYPSDSAEMPDKLRHSLGRLFAASPGLLAACKAALNGGGSAGEWERTREVIRAAVAKAEGPQAAGEQGE